MRWIIISFFCFLSKSVGQSFTAHCNHANSLAASNPNEAIKYYSKLQFFSNDLIEKQVCNHALFKLYTQVNEIKRAKYIADNHLKYYSADTQNILNQQLVLFKYLYKNQYFEVAKTPLNKMAEYGLDSSRLDFFVFSLAFEMFDYQVCRYMTNEEKLKFNNSESIQTSLKKLIKTKRNPRVARRLSLIPGLGQFYAGDIKNAVNSIALLGGIGYGSYWMASQIHPLAAIPVVFFAARYYTGGIVNSGKYAAKHNEKCREKYRQSIFSQVVIP